MDTLAVSPNLLTPAKLPNKNLAHEDVTKVAKEFEAIFVSNFVETMFSGVKTDGPFGGGHAEGVFRSMMVEQYAKQITENGGFGIADSIKRELISIQEGQQK